MLVREGADPLAAGYLAVMHMDDLGAPPNCEHCLIPMLRAGATGAPYGRCPSCDLVSMI